MIHLIQSLWTYKCRTSSQAPNFSNPTFRPQAKQAQGDEMMSDMYVCNKSPVQAHISSPRCQYSYWAERILRFKDWEPALTCGPLARRCLMNLQHALAESVWKTNLRLANHFLPSGAQSCLVIGPGPGARRTVNEECKGLRTRV